MRPLAPLRQHAATSAWRDIGRLIPPIGDQVSSIGDEPKTNAGVAGTNMAARHSLGGMTLRVLFVTSEIDDFVRVGGLAAVSAALPRALQAWSDVRVLLPGYRDVMAQLMDLEIVDECPALADLPACSLEQSTTADGLPIYVLICPTLYGRDGNPYVDANGRDWRDNDVRFARLASAAARLAMGEVDPGWRADLVHANDWPSALTPAYLAWRSARIPTILTIHNLAYQGLFARDTLHRIGAPESAFTIEGIEFYGKVSFLKAGLIYATHLTTVSATYAREITSPAFGCGLEACCASDRPPRSSPASSTASTTPGTRRPAAICRCRSAPATGRAGAPTRRMSAASSASRCRAARCSRWWRAWCTRRASISCSPPPRRSSPPAARSWSWAAASRSSSRRCAPPMRAGRRRSGSRSISTTAKRGGSLPAATSP